MKKKDILKEAVVGKLAARLCLTRIFKELEISVEQGRVVTTARNQTIPDRQESNLLVGCNHKGPI